MLLCKPNKQQVLGFCKNPLAPDCEEIGVGRPVKFKRGEKKTLNKSITLSMDGKSNAMLTHRYVYISIHPWEQTNTWTPDVKSSVSHDPSHIIHSDLVLKKYFLLSMLKIVVLLNIFQ